MKKILCLPFLLISLAGRTQDCSTYYFLQNNKTVEMTSTNKKGEPIGRQVYTVSDVSNSGGTTTALLNSELFDKKGKSTAKAASLIKCTGGVFQINMSMMLNPQQQEQFCKSEVKGDDIYLDYPSSMKVGDQLKDGTFHVDVQNNGGLQQSLTMTVTERKVEAKESITTPAGTWDCFRITFKGKITIKILVPINGNVEGTEWYAPGFGIVKTQTKSGGTEITSIK